MSESSGPNDADVVMAILAGLRDRASGKRVVCRDITPSEALVLRIPILPSFQATLRAIAECRGTSVELAAARLLYQAIVPDRELRRWLVKRDLGFVPDTD